MQFLYCEEPYTFIRNEDLLPNSPFSVPKVYKPLFEAVGDGSWGKSLEDVFYEHEVGPAPSATLGFKHLLTWISAGSPSAGVSWDGDAERAGRQAAQVRATTQGSHHHSLPVLAGSPVRATLLVPPPVCPE